MPELPAAPSRDDPGDPINRAVDGDVLYHEKTLRFHRVETGFNESVRFRVLLGMWGYAALGTIAVDIVYAIFAIIISLAAGGLSAGGVDALLGGMFFLVTVVAFMVLFFFAPAVEPIAEWRTLLEAKSDASDSAYAAIFGSLKRRRIPVVPRPTRVRSDIVPDVVSNRLVITERTYIAYVTVFAYGTSLYVGWMMWRKRRGYHLVLTFWKDVLGRILLRTGLIEQMLRTESARAMREAVHSAVREGVNVAVEGIEVSIVSTFGHDIPVKGGAATPLPPAWGAPPQPSAPPAPSIPSGPPYQLAPPAPTYPSVTYPSVTYPAPTYPAPTYPAPTYPAPTYPAPTYPSPAYPAPAYPSSGPDEGRLVERPGT